MIDTLFVYGTLMRSAAAAKLGRDMRARLEREATWLGVATVAGRLYDLGRYPILIKPSGESELADGEVWRLADAEQAFRWLDPYEGIPPGQLIGPGYERITERVTLESGSIIEAWLYRYISPAATARRIHGRWQPAVPPRPLKS